MFIWVVLSLFGLKSLFATFPLLQTLLALLGAFYLLYLAVMCLKSNAPIKFKPTSTKQAFLSGFLTHILNPKAMLYFSSIFSGFNLFCKDTTLF
ncbi:LysE family translocator [Helicobacter felistomachi]|uniref:LysE family translocator n=1 Tax=Helicobacter felistomachi TaxID=3040201 RepID=UPI00257233CC|nr:LysE family transporter [Helicobacter sp. NHP21005]